MYRKDGDSRKVMFAIGLLMCIPLYVFTILGIDNSLLPKNIFYWSPLTIILAFIYTLLSEIFSSKLKKYKNLFLLGTVLTVALYFIPYPIDSSVFLISGVAFVTVLAFIVYAKKFDISSVILFLSVPSFTICFTGIQLGLTELALFSGFATKASMILAFEVAKKHEGARSPILVLKKQLQNSEENFSKLFSILPDPAVIVDEKGTFLALTPSVISITGFQKEELIGTNFMTTNLISAHSKAILIKNLAKRMLGFHIAPYEIELRSKDGKILQFELNALKIEYNGNPADMVIFRDLTERNRLLEFSNLLFEFAPDPYYLSDLRGNFVDGNRAAQQLIGFDKKELIGKSFLNLQLLQKRQIPKAAQLLALNRLGKSTGPDEFLLNRRDASQISLEISTYPLKTKEQTVVLGIARDITERKRAESAIRESEDKFRTIFEKANDGLLLVSLDGGLIDLNPKAEELFKIDKQISLGKTFEEIGLQSFSQTIRMELVRIRPNNDKKEKLIETVITWNDGKARDLEITSSFVKKDDYNVSLLLVVRDITDRKQIEAEIG